MLNIICALYSQQTYNAVLLGWGESSGFFVLLFLAAKPEVIRRNSKWSVGKVLCSAADRHWWWLHLFFNRLLFSRDFHRLSSQLALCDLRDRDLYTAVTHDHVETEGAWWLAQGQRTRASQSRHGAQHVPSVSRTMLSLLEICQRGKEVKLNSYARKKQKKKQRR